MAAQTWMVPQQKYDVIHFIRERYLRTSNTSQYVPVGQDYLKGLPPGDSRGPEPSNIFPWEQMDYGPNLVMTLEVGKDGRNFAYKGNAVRLDAGPGGVSQGRHWMVFDYDTMRTAAAWSGQDFVDWNGINFNGKHNIHPRVVGDVQLANPTGPGWGRPGDGSFADVRLVGRDNRRYGPLPRDWAHYQGMYYHGARTILKYTVGESSVLEMPGVVTTTLTPVFTRTLNIGPRREAMILQVAHHSQAGATLAVQDQVALMGHQTPSVQPQPLEVPQQQLTFDGATRVEINNTKGLNVNRGDFTITARIKTKSDGTLLAQTDATPQWVHDGLTWFIRGGRLTVDIGWVGAFQSSTPVADGRWHRRGICLRGEVWRNPAFRRWPA